MLPKQPGPGEARVIVVADRLIPLVTSPIRNRPCDSPSLGPTEEATAPVREKVPEYDRKAIDLPQYDGKAEKRLPIRGIVNSLILDQRQLRAAEPLSELDRAAHKLCQRLLESDDPRKQVRGLRFWAAIRKHQIRWRELEVQLAKVAIEALTAETLARLHLERTRSKPGATPEQVSQQVAEVLRGLAASEAREA